MYNNFFGYCQAALKNSYLKIGMVIVTIAIIGFSTVSHYGFSIDEATEMAMVRRNYELITKGQPIPSDLKYFGTLFNFTAEALFQINQYFHKGPGYSATNYEGDANDEKGKIKALYERMRIKHPLTFFTSLIAYLSVTGIVGILCGWEYAWLAPIVLALFPRFWGHSFFNPKDIPFASFFTLCTYGGAHLINYYQRNEPKLKLEFNKIYLFSISYGILIGMLSSIRIGGFLMLFFILAAHIGVTLGQGISQVKNIYKYAICYILMFLAWAATVTILQPASWANPVAWFFETIGYLSKHPLPIKTLFEGTEYPIQDIPWHFTSKWMLISIPIIFQISFLVGLGLLALKYKKFSDRARACSILVLLQIFALPIIAVVKHSSGYDDMRHYLFVLPGIASIATAALIWSYQALAHKKAVQLGSIAFLITVFAAILIEMIQLHPYQYVYFNRLSGGLAAAVNRYEIDYWALSLREGMEWLNKNANPKQPIIVAGALYPANLFADPNLTVISLEKATEKGLSKPFYYLPWGRWGFPKQFPECPIVHRVEREGVTLTSIKHCQ